jgi:hypothetical protein
MLMNFSRVSGRPFLIMCLSVGLYRAASRRRGSIFLVIANLQTEAASRATRNGNVRMVAKVDPCRPAFGLDHGGRDDQADQPRDESSSRLGVAGSLLRRLAGISDEFAIGGGPVVRDFLLRFILRLRLGCGGAM